MLTWRRAVALSVVLAIVVVSASGGATGIIILPYFRGNANVAIGKTVQTKCVGDVNTISSCEGAACIDVGSYPCLPFACAADGLGCTPTCVSDANCGQGATCNTITGECASYDATCVDMHTAKSPNGQLMSCAPYRCVAGRCQQQCSADRPSDCASGFTCKRSPPGGSYNCYPAGGH